MLRVVCSNEQTELQPYQSIHIPIVKAAWNNSFAKFSNGKQIASCGWGSIYNFVLDDPVLNEEVLSNNANGRNNISSAGTDSIPDLSTFHTKYGSGQSLHDCLSPQGSHNEENMIGVQCRKKEMDANC
jgi:hypothetical protein